MAQPAAAQMELSISTQEALEGLGIEAATELPDELFCAICHGPVFGGITLPCEHLYKKCIEASLRTARRCPMCRQENVDLKPMPRPITSMMDRYRVCCPQSCGDDVQWGILEAHVKDMCSKTPFRCQHQSCSTVVSRDQWAAHAGTCDEALLTCKCGLGVRRKEMQSHLSTSCPKVCTPCVFCGQSNVHRGNMEKHLREDCQAAATVSFVKPWMDKIAKVEMAQTAQVNKIAGLERALAEQTKGLLRAKLQLDNEVVRTDKLEEELSRLKEQRAEDLAHTQGLERELRRLAEEVAGTKKAMSKEVSKTQGLERDLKASCGLAENLAQALGTSFHQATFKISLPTKICALPVQSGVFERTFGRAWRIRIFPKGQTPEDSGWVSVFLGLTGDACRETVVGAQWEVQVGPAKKQERRVLGAVSDGGSDQLWGSAKFAKQEAVQHERVIYVKMSLTNRSLLVDL